MGGGAGGLHLGYASNVSGIRINTSNNVGIGATNPNAMLQIGDGSSEATLFHSYDQYNEVKFYGFSDTTDSGVWQFINDGTWNQTRFFIQDANNSSSRLTLHVKGNNGATEILAATSAGNVGIGTEGPNALLHVYSAGNGEIEVERNGGALINLQAQASKAVIGTDSNHQLDLKTNGGTRMSLLTNGNVGIGSTSPTVKLDVNGNIKASQVGVTNIVTNKIVKFGGTYLDDSIIHDDGTNIGIGTSSISSSAKVTIQADNSNQIHTGLVINSYQSTTATAGNGVGIVMGQDNGVYSSKIANVWTNNNPSYLQTNIAFYTMHDSYVAGSETEKMRLTSQGRLGIGVTNPSERLEVNPDNDSSAILGRAHVGYIGYGDYAGFSHVDMNATNSFALVQYFNGETYLNTAAGRTLHFQVNNSEAGGFNSSKDFFVDTDTLYVDVSTDRVGIGVNDPDATLEIKSTGTSVNTEAFRVRNANNTELFRIEDNGVVTVPSQYFYAASSAGAYVQHDLRVRGRLLNDQGTLVVSGDVNFDSDTLYVDSTNNRVGIGTTSLIKELQVNGSVLTKNNGGYLSYDFQGNIATILNLTTANELSIGQASHVDSMSFNVGGTDDAIFINSSANVGIGTIAPDYKLHVSGAIALKGGQSADRECIHFQASDESNRFTIETDLDSSTSNDKLGFVSSFGQSYKKDILFLRGDGNVGIGTNNPAEKLVMRSSNSDCVLILSASDSLTHNSTIKFGDNDSSSRGIIQYAHNGDSMRFTTAATEAVRIDSSQRVGIGTNSVYGFTHINGRMLVESPTVPSTLAISDSGDVTKALRLGYEPTWDAASIAASDFGAGWKDIAIAPVGGKVGIGTTDTPSGILDVNGVAYFRGGTSVGHTSNETDAAMAIKDDFFIHTQTNNNYLRRLIGKDSSHNIHVGESQTELIQSIKFYAGSSANAHYAFHGGATERMRIEGGGNVGIGTNDPPQKLSVKGTIVHVNDSNVQVVGITNSNGHGRIYANGSDGVTDILFDSNGDSYINGGNVGIGTTDPSAHLTIAKTDPKITLYDTAGANSDPNGEITFNETATSENFAIKYNGANDRLEFNSPLDGNTGIMVITRSENVGIGVTNPDATLEVKSTGNTIATTSFVVRDSDDAVLLKTRNDGVVTVEHNYFYVSSSAGAYVQNNLRVRGSLFNDQGTLNIGNSSGTAFDGDVNFDSNTLFVDTSTNRIGLGTSSPDYTLDVGGDIGIGDYAMMKSTSQYMGMIGFNRNGNNGAIYNNSYGAFQLQNNNGLLELQCYNSAGAAQTIHGFTSAGNVGIGTTSPSQKLSVVGGHIELDDNRHIQWGGSNNRIEGNDASDYIRVFTAGTERVRVSSAGNVGIGTASPSANLDIYNGSSWSELHLDGANGGEIKLQKAGTTHLDIYASDAGSTASVIKAQSHLQLASNNSTAANSSIYLKSNGNVGIGTDSPSGTLHVSNTGSEYTDKFIVDGSHGRLFNVSDETTGIIFSVNDAAGLPVLEVDSTSGYDKVSIGEFGTNALVVSGSKVGIGTDNPALPFQVSLPTGVNVDIPNMPVRAIGFGNFAGSNNLPTIVGKSDNSMGLL